VVIKYPQFWQKVLEVKGMERLGCFEELTTFLKTSIQTVSDQVSDENRFIAFC
jgi:hypothetical protein